MERRLNKFLISGIIFSCLVLGACRRGAPKGIIKPVEMENVLYDFQVAQVMLNDLPYEEDYKKSLYTDYVFEKYQITQSEFDSSMVWYTRQAEELTKIYGKVSKRLKDRQSALNHQIAMRDRKPVMTAPGDTVDIWYANRLYCLTESPVSNKLEFTIPSDANFKACDAIVWKLRYIFFSKDKKSQSAIMALSIRYDNDSVISIVKQISQSGLASIRLKSDSAYLIKEVKGFVFRGGINEPENNLLLDNISMVRYHEQSGDKIKKVERDSIGKQKGIDRKAFKIQDSIPQNIESAKMQSSVRLTPQEMNRSHIKKR